MMHLERINLANRCQMPLLREVFVNIKALSVAKQSSVYAACFASLNAFMLARHSQGASE